MVQIKDNFDHQIAKNDNEEIKTEEEGHDHFLEENDNDDYYNN